ncbi:MAG: hypothetical protein NVSMB14_03400 [Isosphaeraceae bacterium]
MPFYVPLGPRGLLFRAGTIIHNVVGGWLYWRSRAGRIAELERRSGEVVARERSPGPHQPRTAPTVSSSGSS